MLIPLKDQVVLVIGASSGIGRETAILFANEGARVMASARRQDRLDSLKTSHPSIETFVADASHSFEMETLARETEARLGPIDILVFVAGTNIPDRALNRLTVDLWDMMVTTNLNSAYYATSAILPSMRVRQAGHLIYISSISGIVPDISGAAYQAAKRGLIGFAHAIRVEEKANGIRTCAVCPGLVETEILEKRPVKPSAEVLAKALQPEDVAEAVVAIAKLPARVAIPELQIMPTLI
jgi:NADP-dependent 3-hydroxy acid dehydrogenase YdfG